MDTDTDESTYRYTIESGTRCLGAEIVTMARINYDRHKNAVERMRNHAGLAHWQQQDHSLITLTVLEKKYTIEEIR
jgi:hypothetical protein